MSNNLSNKISWSAKLVSQPKDQFKIYTLNADSYALITPPFDERNATATIADLDDLENAFIFNEAQKKEIIESLNNLITAYNLDIKDGKLNYYDYSVADKDGVVSYSSKVNSTYSKFEYTDSGLKILFRAQYRTKLNKVNFGDRYSKKIILQISSYLKEVPISTINNLKSELEQVQ
jgi:hypothetical protein